MAADADKERETRQEQERVPLGQVVFDEVFLLFLLSLVISFVIYNLWGMLELLRTPLSP